MWSNCAEFPTRPRYYSCMNEEDPIKNEGARVLTKSYIVFFQKLKGYRTPKSAMEFCRNSFMVVLVTCKNEEDPIKNEGPRVLSRFSPLKVYGNFFKRSRAAN